MLLTLPVTGARLATATSDASPGIEIVEAASLQAGMEALRDRRDKFDTLILSPGAPSYGQLERPGLAFSSFEERGRAFVRIAGELFGQ